MKKSKKTRRKSKKRSLRKVRILSEKKYKQYIQKRKSNKRLTKKQNKQLDHTLMIKYCKCIKKIKYDKKIKKNLEYPFCASSIYKKRKLTTPKNVKKRCKKYKL